MLEIAPRFHLPDVLPSPYFCITFCVAGPAIVISFAFGGLAALIASLCYAEYAADVPISGGAFNYISLTFGEFPAWWVSCDAGLLQQKCWVCDLACLIVS